MFTGLVEELGVLRGTARGADSARLTIEAREVVKDVRLGDSIAVNGVCLTVVEYERGYFVADVMAETLSKTNLGNLKPGDRVNLERAMRLGDRLGGHLVSGHIDGVGNITRKERYDIATLITVAAPPQVIRYTVKKGSIAVDGASLTVVDLDQGSFKVSLIPHTAHMTTLGIKKVGDTVNLEADIIGKYVERLLGQAASQGRESGEAKGITVEYLAEKGFM